MKITIILALFSYSLFANEAEKHIKRAMLEYPEVRLLKERVEDNIVKKLPIDKKTASVVGGMVITATKGYFDTQTIKRMNINVLGGKLNPSIRYDFKNSYTRSSFILEWRF